VVATLASIQIFPNHYPGEHPFTFRLSRVELLVPDEPRAEPGPPTTTGDGTPRGPAPIPAGAPGLDIEHGNRSEKKPLKASAAITQPEEPSASARQ
jgi:hypothetical protein